MYRMRSSTCGAAAASTFVPIMQYHSEFNHHRTPSRDRTPWNIAERSGDASGARVFREFAELRERLVPYLVDQAAVTIATARPLMRPLYFDDPDLEECGMRQPQWMLGDDLLVAPVLEAGVTSWPVLLPDGSWENAWTGELVEGPGPSTWRRRSTGSPSSSAPSAAERLRAVFGR